MALPGYPVNTTYRTVAMDQYGVPMCGSPAECKKGLGPSAHMWGRVDRYGTLHWDRADLRLSKRGARNLYKFLALAVNRDYWTMPWWKRLYSQNVWAYKEIERTLHFRPKHHWSNSDRKRIAVGWPGLRYKPTNTRNQEPNFYMWMWRGGYNLKHGSVTKTSR